MWTQKHDQFCLTNRIPPAGKLLWQWLIREGLDTEVEPDLSDFQKWVEKHRGTKYAHHYLKKMFQRLVDLRVVQVVKQYSWKIFKLIVRPLEYLKPRKKQKLQNHNTSYKIQQSNLSKSVECDIQQQQILSNQELLTSEGINFVSSEKEVLNRPAYEIKAALLLFKIRGAREKILNPEGWLRHCLRGRYWEQPTNYSVICQHFDGAVTDIEDYFR
ncbi:MAG: hypothetical protein F6K62_12805 [Sphaerospermopsis sp. SIO1G2]|nr:hypothetical protein [Sphaerospermopsis sp. SIO1G2]